MLTHPVGLRVSLALSLVALIMVALAENGRVPVDNPTTHLELTMVHEAMVLEYSGRHLAMIEAAAALKLIVLPVADRVRLPALRHGAGHCGRAARARSRASVVYLAKLALLGASRWPCSR